MSSRVTQLPKSRHVVVAGLLLLLVAGCSQHSAQDPARLPDVAADTGGAADFSRYGLLEGTVAGTRPEALPIIYALNDAGTVGYSVFVVDGEYRAPHMLPGSYTVTLRPAIGQMHSFAEVVEEVTIEANARSTLDFAIAEVYPQVNYVGGMPYDIPYTGAEILPYDVIYPPGPGREVLERTCHGCHQVQFFPYNVDRSYSGGRKPKDRDGWTATVDRMHKAPAFGRPGKAPMFDPALLPPGDRDLLIDYLAEHFPADAPPTLVQLEREVELDPEALRKAMFVDYIYREPEGMFDFWPWPHQIDFDADGNVWNAYTGCCIVRYDPRTGENEAFHHHGGGHGVVVDQTDGTVWYSGDAVRRLDPKTGKVDYWKIGEDPFLRSNTQIFDSKGDLWLSFLAAGGLGKWDRERDTLVWWEVPVVASRPYGIIVDKNDHPWFADYHNGGVTRFNPETEEFTHFPLVEPGFANSIRRLGVDSRNHIWAGTWGNLAFDRALLYELNPDTGEVTTHDPGIPYGSLYNAEADPNDNIWIAPDNYVSKYDPRADNFTHYPLTTRSDSLKTTIARNGGVWFIYRNAGKYEGSGGNAIVLYPDKDALDELGAYHWEGTPGARTQDLKDSPAPPTLGMERVAWPAEARNAAEYAAWARAQGLLAEEAPEIAATAASLASPAVSDSDEALIAIGEAAYSVCIGCHTIIPDGAHMIGPNLHGILGQPAGAQPGFSYSSALADSELVWTEENLERYLASPQGLVADTSMVFAGVADAQTRRALIAYINSAAAARPRLPSDQGEEPESWE